MKIGVVCEGMTDFFAINHYVGAALQKAGVRPQFVALQPASDNTSGGGWGNVLSWLEQNPPKARQQLFGRGLFANSKRLSGLDSILIHLDTDILSEKSFQNFLGKRKFKVGKAATVAQKSEAVSKVIFHFGLLTECDPEQQKKHVSAPIADSSEAWCIAVDPEFSGSAELLCGQELIDAFGASLARFNKKAVQPAYKSINKKTKSRERYCLGTSHEFERLSVCSQFVSLVDNLKGIAPPAF